MNILDHSTFPENDEYHANPILSYTGFKRFLESPLHFREHVDTATPAMLLGSLCHSMTFEPWCTSKDFRVRADMPLRSKDDKAAYIAHLFDIGAKIDPAADLTGLKADELRALELTAPIRFVDQSTWENAERVAIAATVKGGFDRSTVTDSNVEAAFTAVIEGAEVQCKCDYVDAHNRIWDLKTTGQLAKWIEWFEKCDMLLGDCWYRMVIEDVTGYRPDPIRYLGAETVYPFDTAIRWYDDSDWIVAEETIRAGLIRYRECLESDYWPGMDGGEDAHEVKCAAWKIRELKRRLYGEAGSGITDTDGMTEDELAEYLMNNLK